MKRETLEKHLRRVLKEAQKSYRTALAAQVRGEDDTIAWAEFHEATSALLMSSWLFGALDAVKKGRIPEAAVSGIIESDGVTVFDRMESGISLEGFGTKWMRPVTDWFRGRVPVTRENWQLLIAAANASAGDVTDHERQNALPDLRRRSPILDSLLRGVTRPSGGITQVKRIVDSTFFVTGMTMRQTRQVQELIAQVIEEKPTASVVGKKIRTLGLGDFVTTAQALTGTKLSTARLETVLRTNTNRALTEGNAEILRDDAVQAFVPLVEYSATLDPRTRQNHRAMDGYVGTMADFDRMGIAPPCGFNCRCTLIPVPISMAIDKGWVQPNGALNYAAIRKHNGARQKVIDARKIPDPGFVNA